LRVRKTFNHGRKKNMKAKYLSFLVPVLMIGCSKGGDDSSPTAGVAEQQVSNLPMEQQMMFARLQTLNDNEIKAGQMAASKACNADVKQYGQTLVDDHTAMNQQLAQLKQDAENAAVSSGGANGSGSENNANGSSSGANGSSGASGSSGTNGSASNGSSSNNGSSATAAEAGNDQPFTADQQQELQKQQDEMNRLNGLSDCSFDRGFLEAMVTAHEFAIQIVQNEQASAEAGSPMADFLQSSLDKMQAHLQTAQDLEDTIGNEEPTPTPTPSTSPSPSPSPSATPTPEPSQEPTPAPGGQEQKGQTPGQSQNGGQTPSQGKSPSQTQQGQNQNQGSKGSQGK
jgi:predicted outer membrane protein